MYIVLPPELSWRAINILVQYIYTGEATVSTDILNEVLRGGELLKIRGLWRNQHNNEHNGAPVIEKSVIEHSSKQKEVRESIIYERHNLQPSNEDNQTIIPKDSPVIVMPSVQTQQSNHIASGAIQSSHPTLIVKKDVAIDPGDVNNIPSTHYGLVSLQIAAAVKKAQESEKQQHKSSNFISDTSNFNDTYSGSLRMKEVRVYENEIQLQSNSKLKNTEPPQQQSNNKTPETLNFLAIKQEPIDWMEFDQKSNDTKHLNELPVKPEIIHSDAEDSCSNHGSIYSLLTCELCSATFTVPGEWVRHIENHPETSNVLPKRRRRIDVSIVLDLFYINSTNDC